MARLTVRAWGAGRAADSTPSAGRRSAVITTRRVRKLFDGGDEMRVLLAADSVLTAEMLMNSVASRPWPRGTRARVISVVEDDAVPEEVWREADYSVDAVRQEMG